MKNQSYFVMGLLGENVLLLFLSCSMAVDKVVLGGLKLPNILVTFILEYLYKYITSERFASLYFEE